MGSEGNYENQGILEMFGRFGWVLGGAFFLKPFYFHF